MKKIICTIAAVCGVVMINAFNAEARTSSDSVKKSIENVVDNYRGYSNFEVVKIGKAMMSFAKVTSGKAEIKGLESIIVVDYSDCDANTKNSFTVELLRAAKDFSKLVEATEDGTTVSIFGQASEDGQTVSNPMILTSDGELVCMFGTITASDVKSLSELD